MLSLKKLSFISSVAILVSAFMGLSNTKLEAQIQRTEYTNPVWAPPSSISVRYYYLPDIETYYDLANQDFVYLQNGQWQFSYALPAIYQGFDLYNAYTIALDLNVYEPWMHHHFYLSNYPRYYYKNYYASNTNITNLRGFNENLRQPLYWTQQERNRIAELRGIEHVEERKENSRPSQAPRYYGKNIGKPVKVQPQMREKRDPKNERDERHTGHN